MENRGNSENSHEVNHTDIDDRRKDANIGGEGEPDGQSKLRGYKIVCAKLGLAMSTYFIFRLLLGPLAGSLFRLTANMGETARYIIFHAAVIIMVYVIPLLITALIFNSFKNYKGKYRQMYKKPKRLARALGTFPAVYGFSYGVALLTLLASFLLSRWLGGQTLIEDLLRPTTLEPTTNLASILMMVFMMVIIAPVFEEIWVRGIMYDALKPYGTGMAIIISSVIFGLMHGSLQMLFYTTAAGFAFGYIRYATGSLLIVTIIHAMVNAIAAGLLIFLSLQEIVGYQYRLLNTASNLYTLAVFIFVIIGVIVFLAKIPAIRKYTFESSWTDVGPWKKIGLFLISVPVIFMLVLAFNEHSGDWLLHMLLR